MSVVEMMHQWVTGEWERPVYWTIVRMMKQQFEYGGTRPDTVVLNKRTYNALHAEGADFNIPVVVGRGRTIAVRTDYGELAVVVSETLADGQVVLADMCADSNVYHWMVSKGKKGTYDTQP